MGVDADASWKSAQPVIERHGKQVEPYFENTTTDGELSASVLERPIGLHSPSCVYRKLHRHGKSLQWPVVNVTNTRSQHLQAAVLVPTKNSISSNSGLATGFLKTLAVD